MDTSNSQEYEYSNSDLDEGFSFTYCDFNSNEVVSGGDDDDDDDDDDDESCIEIALEPLPTENDDDLKLSFSSSRVPLKELLVDQVSSSSSSSLLSSSSSETLELGERTSSGPSAGTINPKGDNSMRRLQFSAINRVLNAFVSSFRVPSSEETGRIDGNRRPAASSGSRTPTWKIKVPSSQKPKYQSIGRDHSRGKTRNQDSKFKLSTLTFSSIFQHAKQDHRKSPWKVTTAINGSITKIMIKLRSFKMGPALTSFVKLPGPQLIEGNNGKSVVVEEIMSRSGRKRSKRSAGRPGAGLMEINMEAIKGVLMEAISSISMSSNTSTGGSWRSKQIRMKTKTKSCPVSIKCSPINESSRSVGYSRENSVQGAIAHCKRSFGQPQDFSFLK